MHEGQLVIDAAVAERLIAAQFPQWRGRAVRPVTGPGTQNAIFRIGDDLAARFPLQPGEVEAVRAALVTEAAAAAELHGRTRFATPRPVAIGEPGAGYPLPWAVQTWLPGVMATIDEPAGSDGFGRDLAEFVSDLRSIDTRGRRFQGGFRGGDLRHHDAWVQTCLQETGRLLDVTPFRAFWAEWRELPREAPDVMSHGDLTPVNVLVAHGRLAGVLDVGGFGPADPALDLIAAWSLLKAGPRAVFRAGLDCSELDWQRGRAWALEQALGLVWYYAVSNPPMSALGRRMLARLSSG